MFNSIRTAFDDDSYSNFWLPLSLSTIAGASTCVGAGIVFCLNRQVSPSLMSFSLALAGSVMVTVSVVSIGPEVLWEHEHGTWVSPPSLVHRAGGFLFGGGLYFLLSRHCAPPEPVEVMTAAIGGTTTVHSYHTHTAVKDSEGEEEETSALSPSSSSSSSLRKQLNQRHTTTVRRGTSTSSLDEYDVGAVGSGGGEDEGENSLFCHDAERIGSLPSSPLSPSSFSLVQSHSHSQSSTHSWLRAALRGSDLETTAQQRAWRVSVLLFVSLLAHNFPEGLAVAASSRHSVELGVTVTLGILVHNVPEGIAIAVPCLAARPDRPMLAFGMASLSGLAEPAGAWVALVWMSHDDDSDEGLGVVLAAVAGVMVAVAAYELFPEARRMSTVGVGGSGNGTPTKAPIQALWSGTVAGTLLMLGTELYVGA